MYVFGKYVVVVLVCECWCVCVRALEASVYPRDPLRILLALYIRVRLKGKIYEYINKYTSTYSANPVVHRGPNVLTCIDV